MQEIQSEKIKEIRTKRKMSQKNLGKYLGISDRAVSKWERGESKPSARNLITLSKVLGVPIEFFLSKSEYKVNHAEKSGMESIRDFIKLVEGLQVLTL